MEEGNQIDNNIIVRFLLNEASEQDVQRLEKWIASDEKNEQFFHQVRNTWNSVQVEKDLDDWNIKHDYDDLLHRIDNRSFFARLLINNWIVRTSAIFLLGIMTAWVFIQYNNQNTPAENLMNVVETPKGSTVNILLPDGSKVLLNADSKLTYAQNFTPEERSIFLEGEAFFEVAKDSKRRFLVKTSDITVKVFGTSFNVKSYPDENTTETTLVEGSISIIKNSMNESKTQTELKMEPNQRLVLYKENEKGTQTGSPERKIVDVPPINAKLVISKSVDTRKYTSWKDGHLNINQEPMDKLAITLERRYDVKIHFEEEDIKQLRYTGTFKNETIEQVMVALKLASSIDYEIDERDIWIKKQMVD